MEYFIYAGGIYTSLLIVFHLLFWRIFKWRERLAPLDWVNRSTVQVLNLGITFLFVMLAYVSFFHTRELLHSELGKSLLIFISALWFFRAALQIHFYKLKHPASIGLTGYFLLGGILYGAPLVA